MAYSKKRDDKQLETILITGGCGFIGLNLVKYLSEKGYKVKILDSLSTGKEKSLRQLQSQTSRPFTVSLVTGDVRNSETVRQATQGVDAVVHLAAYTSVLDSLANPQETMEINVTGTLNLLEACRQNRVKRFILASSNAAVGEQIPPIDEQKVPRPVSPYGASKLAAEALCCSYYYSFGLKTVSLRFANCYGPYSEHKSSVIAKFMKRVKEGKPLIIYGDGKQTRDFVHVNDVCQAIHLALTTTPRTRRTLGSKSIAQDFYGDVFQIGTGIETNLNQLAELIRRLTDDEIQIVYQAERQGEIKRNYSDISKARKLLGFEPRIKLSEGLTEMWQIIQSDGD